jgi:signal peptidase II
MATRGARLMLFVIVILTIGCDQVSKRVASTHLVDTPRKSFLGDAFRLEYAENRGAFLSLGADLPSWARTALFTVGTGIVLLVGAVSLFTHTWSPLAVIGICLYLAGGASNLADRLVDGHVIDFLNIGLGPLRTGIFNVADIAVMTGVVLFLIGHFRSPMPDPRALAPAARDTVA